MGKPVLNADGKPPGGRACGSFGLSRGSLLNRSFEPQTATLFSRGKEGVVCLTGYSSPLRSRSRSRRGGLSPRRGERLRGRGERLRDLDFDFDFSFSCAMCGV